MNKITRQESRALSPKASGPSKPVEMLKMPNKLTGRALLMIKGQTYAMMLILAETHIQKGVLHPESSRSSTGTGWIPDSRGGQRT